MHRFALVTLAVSIYAATPLSAAATQSGYGGAAAHQKLCPYCPGGPCAVCYDAHFAYFDAFGDDASADARRNPSAAGTNPDAADRRDAQGRDASYDAALAEHLYAGCDDWWNYDPYYDCFGSCTGAHRFGSASDKGSRGAPDPAPVHTCRPPSQSEFWHAWADYDPSDLAAPPAAHGDWLRAAARVREQLRQDVLDWCDAGMAHLETTLTGLRAAAAWPMPLDWIGMLTEIAHNTAPSDLPSEGWDSPCLPPERLARLERRPAPRCPLEHGEAHHAHGDFAYADPRPAPRCPLEVDGCDEYSHACPLVESYYADLRAADAARSRTVASPTSVETRAAAIEPLLRGAARLLDQLGTCAFEAAARLEAMAEAHPSSRQGL